MSYDDYDDYSSSQDFGEGFSSQEEELQNLGGFQIEGADEPTDAADDWLSQNDPSRVYGNDLASAISDSGWKPEKLDLPSYAEGESLSLEKGDSISPDIQEGMATVSDLQLQRIMHMPTDVRIAVKAILSGERQGISVNKAYLSHGNLDAAASAFASTIGGDPVDFAKRIKVNEDEVASKVKITHFNDDITGERLSTPTEYKVEGIVRDPIAIRTAYSMLSKTAEGYMAKGPGQSLAGQVVTEEQDTMQGRKEAYVWGALESLAELYIPEETRQSSIYGSRKEQVTNELVKRFMNQNLSKHGRKENVTLPLPAEMDIMGLVPNAAVWGGYTSPYGRLEYDEFISGRHFPAGISEEDRDALEFQHYGMVKPNLRKSLFPVGKGESKEESKRLMAKANKRAAKVQKGLLQLYPNLAGESTGNQFLQGFYHTEENPRSLQYELAQAEKLSLIDALQREGVEGSIYADQKQEMPDDKFTPRSELSEAIAVGRTLTDLEREENLTGERIFANTDLGRYQRRQHESPAPEQRSAEWFAQRKGRVTASQAGKLLGRNKTQLKLTAQLARERLGTEEEFFANDPMRQGTKFEEKVLTSFMAQKGKNLHHEEAYFETRPELPGIGASPDGMLYDKVTGEFEGLLELKLLQSSSRMEGALKDYNAQMQMQMLVTGAHQTHFYAMNAKTGDVLHEVVKADPELQEVLRLQAYKVSREAESLDEAGVAKLEEQIKSLPTGRKAKTQKELEQEKARKLAKANSEAKLPNLDKEEEEVATVFDSGKQYVHGVYNESAGSAATTKLAQALESADQRDRMKESTEAARALSEQPMDRAVGLYQMDKIRKDFVRDQQEKSGTLRAANIEGTRAEQEAEGAARAAEIEEAYRNQVEAANKSSKALEAFGSTVREAAQGLGKLGQAVVDSTAGEMDTIRLAAKAGLDAESTRGISLLMQSGEGGMTEQQANQAILTAGQQTKDFSSLKSAAAETTRMHKYLAESVDSQNIRDKFEVPDPKVMMNMNPEERLEYSQTQINKFSDPVERAKVAELLNQPDMAVSRVNPQEYKEAYKEMHEEESRATHEGVRDVREWVQENIKQPLGTVGEFGGELATAATYAGGAVTAGYAGYKGLKRLKDIRSRLPEQPSKLAKPSASSKVSKLTTATAEKATSLAKKLPTSAKFTPIGMAVGVGSQVAREVMDVEEDSGMDSALDIVEFAATGAAIGSLVPGVGTVVGGAVGGAIGVVNEVWQHFSRDEISDTTGRSPAVPSDSQDMADFERELARIESGDAAFDERAKASGSYDVMPSEDIGQMRLPSSKGGDKAGLNSNVEVKVEVSPELIETTVNNNGDVYLDRDNSQSLTGVR